MAVTWQERWDSRTYENGSISYRYTLGGIADHALARGYAIAATPSLDISTGLWRTNIRLEPLGTNLWKVEIPYGKKESKDPEVGDFSWSFDTGGGTEHITNAKEHIQSYVASGTAPDHKGAINVNAQGDVEGCDVVQRQFKWQENWKLLLADFGWEFTDILTALTGRYNSAAFRGKEANTVLLEHATGGQSAKEPLLLDVTFHFIHSPNVTGQTVGDITGVAKKGWHYAWVEYETADGGAAKQLIRKPKAVHVERVLDPGDFSLLGIGTDPF